LPLLVEVGLGISRRLNAQSEQQKRRPPPDAGVSFWYLANRLGRIFLQAAASQLGPMAALGAGVWKSAILGHPCFLVSAADLPVDEDSLPLHVLGIEPLEQQLTVGKFLIEEAERLDVYGTLFAALHPAAWKELVSMARTKQESFHFDLQPLVDEMGLANIIQQLGKKKLIEQIVATLTPAERRALRRRLRTESEKAGK